MDHIITIKKIKNYFDNQFLGLSYLKDKKRIWETLIPIFTIFWHLIEQTTNDQSTIKVIVSCSSTSLWQSDNFYSSSSFLISQTFWLKTVTAKNK